MCVFTIVQYEPDFFPLWYNHYQKHFLPEEIHILHHVLPTPKNEAQAQRKTEWDAFITSHQATHGYHLIEIHNDQSFDHEWLRQVVCNYQRTLLQTHPWVLFAEVDEIIAPHPRTELDIKKYAEQYFSPTNSTSRNTCICDGYEIVQKVNQEKSLDLTQPILPQRQWWYWSKMYSKPLLSKVPLTWCWGFHACNEIPVPYHYKEADFLLLHLHKVDWDVCLKRHCANAERQWKHDVFGYQNRIINEIRLSQWWNVNIDQKTSLADLVLIPEEIKSII